MIPPPLSFQDPNLQLHYGAQPIPREIELSIEKFMRKVKRMGFDLSKPVKPNDKGWYGVNDSIYTDV